MTIDFSRMIQKTSRIRLVRVLKMLQKPFALWPVIAAFARPLRTLVHRGLGHSTLTPKLRRPLPAWSALIMLLLGAGLGFYSSTIINQAVGIGQSTAPDFTLATNPVSITASQGSLATIAISLTSLNSFAGSVNLNHSLSPGIT